ncbi:hypothetical protein pb186bvf_015043 [Paramecium bursaria]
MDVPDKEELQKQIVELRDLLLKLNQDKNMFEKKVQRKSQELTKLKSQYDTIVSKLMTQKHIISQQTDQETLIYHIIDELIYRYNEGNQQQIQTLQNQMKEDLQYYNRKIKQNEEQSQELLAQYDQKYKDILVQNQLLRAKQEFLYNKILFYQEATVDINKYVNEVSQLRNTIQENTKKAEDDLINKHQNKVQLLDARNSFLIEQIKILEEELQSFEKLVTSIEQQTMQTKKRGKQ